MKGQYRKEKKALAADNKYVLSQGFAVHADVLKVAKMEERRELIKWIYARRVFMSGDDEASFGAGLALARQCQHEDARFLVSLFPDAPTSRDAAAAVFLKHDSDARCLCWAGKCGAHGIEELFRRSAQNGYAWGEYCLAMHLDDVGEYKECLKRAAAKGEAEAMASLAQMLSDPAFEELDWPTALPLWREATELGVLTAQWCWRAFCDDSEYCTWLRRATQQWSAGSGQTMLAMEALPRLELCDKKESSGRSVFEIGFGLKPLRAWKYAKLMIPERIAAAERAVAMYEQWCAQAKTSVMCWLWLSRHLLVKDVRLLIADLVWSDRIAWSERAVE